MTRAHLSRLAAVLALCTLGGLFLSLHPFHAHAQVATDSLAAVGDTTGLGSEDPRIVVARIIRVGLGFLGVLAVLLVLYGGFVWMTAGGNDEKIERAKKILVRATIGLAIVLLSFSIASFILSALTSATGTGGSTTGGSSSGGSLGGGSTSSFTVTDFSPDGPVKIRNVQLRVTFSKKLDAATVDGNIVVTNAATGGAVNGTIVVNGNYATFTPSGTCPSPNEDRYCFDADTTFTVTVDNAITSSTGTKLVCSGDRCTSSFLTGSLVDTEDPTATITVPESGDGISVDSTESVQVHATDDSEVASSDFLLDGTAFDSVGAAGDDLSDVTIESTLDTADLKNGTRYSVGVIVTDIAGNTNDDTVSVTARPAWCFNEELDTDKGETGIDCGGDSASADYCGACDGSSCTEDSQCSSGSCVDGACATLPEIASMSPGSGAPGTYVTITGTGFGGSAGSVAFTAADGGTVTADIPSCGDGWSSTSVVVEVPDGAVDGPVTLTTSSGNADATNDDSGALVDDFDVNDVTHPKLCSVTPRTGAPTDAMTVSGFDFGTSQGTSTVTFDTTTAGSTTSWSDTTVGVTVPSVKDGTYDVAVTVGGVVSNTLPVTVAAETASTPTVSAIDPSAGPVGEYVTVSGTNFGARVGTVWFKSAESGLLALASTDFPEACSTDYWSDSSVTVIVPDAFQNGDSVTEGSYSVYVTTADGTDSNATAFTVESGAPGPGICSVTPDTGEAGDTVVIAGERLGSAQGTVTFTSGLSATVADWSSSEVTVTVPSGVATGPVSVTSSSGDESNTVNFAVGTAVASASESVTEASYGWYFTTGSIPSTPEVVVECSDSTVSAVPNVKFTDSVCTNAVVYAEFTTLMNNASVNDAVTVEECIAGGDRPCTDTKVVEGSLTVDDSATASYFTFVPTTAFTTDTTYRVTVAKTAVSTDSVALEDDVSWQFTTAATDAVCTVSKVYVSPTTATIATQGDTSAYHALPVSGCVVTDATDYTWDWTVDSSYADFTASADGACDGGTTSCATIVGLAEGTSPVDARETTSAVTGTGELVVNFTDPYVENAAPNCDAACKDALVYATFNTAMDSASVLAEGAVTLEKCSNELCTNLTDFGDYSVVCASDTDDSSRCKEVDFVLSADLAQNTYYRVTVSGDVTSVSGVPLTRTNYHGDYSWTFRTKDTDATCAVNRLSIAPASATADVIGARQSFAASAFGEPDSCSVAGQELTATGYSWSWTNPIADDGPNDAVNVAAWWDNGVVDTDVEGIAPGCTTLCTAGGSDAYGAICGDRVVGIGEECEDGDTVDGNGCSSRCLHEGSTTTCGDSRVDASEDCDDGNTRDGDGCSAICLDEGSQQVDAVCGNGDVAYDAAIGGEDCDDGNLVRGDGCDTQCLNEGAPTALSIGGAVCGNGTVDAPYENCDTALTAEGCSDRCLLEGSSARYVVPSICGDTTIGTGEECDDKNVVDGDGCSSDCLLEGSSTAYKTPSFCGDGDVGAGEWGLCEATGGDGYVDSTQLSYIDTNAASEVDLDTQEAHATVVVTEPTSGLSTTADFGLSCTAATDLDCPDETTYGVGMANCCMPRPTVTFSQAEGETGVCRNASLYGVFTEEMNAGSFTEEGTAGSRTPRMYAVLDVSTAGGVCPSSHTPMAVAPQSSLGRAWVAVRRFFTGIPAQADTGDCILPITAYEQTANEDGTYTVRMRYGAAMESNATYQLVIATDPDNTDGDAEGVTSMGGVGVFVGSGTDTTSVKFTTGTEICALSTVEVTDTDAESPNYFSQTGEAHTFQAVGYSYENGTKVDITSIPDVYAWEYTSSGDVTSWQDDADEAIVSVAQSSTDLDQATVTAQSENGTSNVVATATIVADDFTGTVGDTVSGSARVTANLCVHPWPELTSFPWEDTDMNFQTYYCRDAGKTDTTTDDYPAVTAVRAATRGIANDNVLREYLFEVDGSTDAIGVRVVSNDDYLSPMAWYEAQGFTGTPSTTTVDGFEAVTDGRTTYVGAANDTGAGIYSNIYVVSYNEGASDDTIAIYEQMLAHMTFATNLHDVALCYDATDTVTATACVSDARCDTANAEYCGDAHGKLLRDTKRLADLTTVAAAVTTYGDENGVCSATADKSCSADSDCPSGESCVPTVPTLSGGTYVRALGASAWTSWSDVLGDVLTLDDSVTDPLNTYEGCGAGTLASYDSATCVDAASGAYVCPDGSHVYHYRAVGNEDITLSADLEYVDGAWVNTLDDDSTDGVTYFAAESGADTSVAGFTTDYFCETATVYGSTGTCGDGVVNTDADGTVETCELGELGGTATACDSDGDGTNDGTQSQTCNSTCSGWTTSTTATCIAASCGNAVVDTGEDCDDGSNNGRYGYCGADCMDATRAYCGDGKLSGGEVCDCGAPGGSVPSGARPYGGSTVSCAGVNGTYDSNPAATCAWDCQGAASYCGDGTTDEDEGEQCDGDLKQWSGKLCMTDGSSTFGISTYEACASDSECPEGNMCGDSTPTSYNSAFDECPTTTVCLAGGLGGSNIGAICDYDADCDTSSGSGDGVCSSVTYPTTRTADCANNGAGGETCTVSSTWQTTACRAIGTCGDGTVDGGEECDDGNTTNTDDCTNECTQNVCGDGYLYSGEEQCDDGAENGEGCTSSYGSTCTACSVSCTYEVSSGDFCGDGEINGKEYCDAYSMPWYYFDAATDAVYGTCAEGDEDIEVDGVTYACRDVGICNGGAHNGEYCTGDSSSGILASASTANDYAYCATSLSALGNGGDCVKPTCNDSCASSCPFSYDDTSVLITTNEAGARGANSVDMHTYSTSATSDVPNAATITIPACDAISAITADVSLDNVEPPETYVLFVTDLSGSMDWAVTHDSAPTSGEDSRLEIAQSGLTAAVGTLYDALGGYVQAGAVGYKGMKVNECYIGGTACASDSDCATSGDVCTTESADTERFAFVSSSGESSLTTEIEGYFADNAGNGTKTYEGLVAAKEIMDDVEATRGFENTRYVIVLLTDGEWTTTDPATIVEDIKDAGYELYTASITDDADFITEVAGWSSGDPADTGVDYAYNAQTDEELTTLFDEIVSSITNIGITIISDDGSDADTDPETDSVTVEEGTGVTLPWPSGFSCDPNHEQELPVRFTFQGSGKIEVSNVQIDYCAP